MDIFISYRRNNSIYAHLVCNTLLSKGYSAFLDVNNKRAGPFPEYLKERITEAPIFLLVVGPDCFQKKPDSPDWYATEIETAMNQNKTIIPILTDGMEWPESKNKWDPNWLSYAKYGKLSENQSIKINPNVEMDKQFEELEKLMEISLKKDCLWKLLTKAVSDCKAQSISDYIFFVKEMHMEPGSEIKLLTDNLKNYDFSPVAKMAIARNISNGAKYTYYIPEPCEDDFNTLKSSIESYLDRNEFANIEIGQWLQTTFLYKSELVATIESLDGIKKSTFTSKKRSQELLKDSLLGSLFKYVNGINEVLSLGAFIDWLKGERPRTPEIDEFLNKIDAIQKFVEKDATLIKKWDKPLSYLVMIKDISNWIMRKKSRNDSESIKQLCKKFGVYPEVVDWLDSSSKATSQENAMENLKCHSFHPPELSFEPCYSFSLFLDSNRNPTVGAWYTASNENDGKVLYDNVVTVHDCLHDDLSTIKKVFESLDKQRKVQ